MLWFSNNGFDVKHFEVFDYDEFFRIGEEYLIQKSGQSIGQWQIEHSNIPLEQKLQLYGTQFDSMGPDMKPLPIKDERHVDERRKTMGLSTIAEYKELMLKTYS